jgi:7-keto-8-aminopelargonate synthetase-like enzyme
MFSHDGSIAPLGEYLDALPQRGILLVDDAHGGGTLGKRGRGTPEIYKLRDTRVVQTISLSKAFGVYGGAVLGAASVIEAIQERSRIFTGNTPPPFPLVNATLTSLKILKTDRALRVRLNANTARIKSALRAADFPIVDGPSPIVAAIPRDRQHASSISRTLLGAGIFPPLIRYAGSPPPGYFRFAISSQHTAAQLDALTEALISSVKEA